MKFKNPARYKSDFHLYYFNSAFCASVCKHSLYMKMAVLLGSVHISLSQSSCRLSEKACGPSIMCCSATLTQETLFQPLGTDL